MKNKEYAVLVVYLPEGAVQQIPIVPIATNVLKKHGLRVSNTLLQLDGIMIYPCEYFCPIEYLFNKCELTDNTRTINHYTATWMSLVDKGEGEEGVLDD